MRSHPPVIRVSAIVLSLAVAFVLVVGSRSSGGGSAVAALPSAAPAALAITATTPSPSPSPAATDLNYILALRGTHCIECYVLWATNSGEFHVAEETKKPVVSTGAAWLGIELATANGTSVRLSDFAGRPVLVELMATWCASCAAQQDTLREARSALPADTVVVSLDVDVVSDPASLASYAGAHGYDWVFAPSPAGLSRSLRDLFGDLVLNPAASPIVVIDRAGTASLAPLGHKDVAAIVALLPGG
jgi:thiol-disulfide isomerase/thioredoxin